jgi:hypothetical protein
MGHMGQVSHFKMTHLFHPAFSVHETSIAWYNLSLWTKCGECGQELLNYLRAQKRAPTFSEGLELATACSYIR